MVRRRLSVRSSTPRRRQRNRAPALARLPAGTRSNGPPPRSAEARGCRRGRPRDPPRLAWFRPSGAIVGAREGSGSEETGLALVMVLVVHRAAWRGGRRRRRALGGRGRRRGDLDAVALQLLRRRGGDL